MRLFRRVLLLVSLTVLLAGTTFAQGERPSVGHPRLWINQDTLPLMQARATADNPIWSEGILVLAEELRGYMDDGTLARGDNGEYAWTEYPGENVAMLFAFVSLMHPDAAERADFAQRAHDMLMPIITAAAQGPAAGEMFRDPYFALSDRSRWYGVAFPLTVDWAYQTFSTEDKALIREVFLRWSAENKLADTTNNNHPEPVDVLNDPALVADPGYYRWANNNYYAAHMRNMGMMALALDPADDPDGALYGYLANATGAWMYVIDHMMRNDIAGGLGAEGFEYSPQSLGYTAQFLLALHTAGENRPAVWGPQVSFDTNPFWDQTIPAYLTSMSPVPAPNEWYGEAYLPAWYGSGQNYWMPDHIEMFGALGVYDQMTGNADRLDALRWIELNSAPGLADGFLERAGDSEQYQMSVLYYLLFEPGAPEPADPRPALPTTWYAEGMRRLSVRTSWADDAAWFTYGLSWNRVDHQSANGNAIEFYRDGEWLTKVRVGYDLDYISSDHMNTITIQNSAVDRESSDYRYMLNQRGSQWLYIGNDGPPPRISTTESYTFASGDSTSLYNTDYENLLDVGHASRDVFWLMPDMIFVYDRAETLSEGRVKQFHLNFPAEATVTDRVASMTTATGQQLFVTSVLPEAADITAYPFTPEVSADPAFGENMSYRLLIEATGAPASTRFLTVLQGADAGVAALPAVRVSGAGFDAVLAGDTLAVFPVDLAAGLPLPLTIDAGGPVGRVLASGLTAGAGYSVTITGNSVTIAAGGDVVADAAGALLR